MKAISPAFQHNRQKIIINLLTCLLTVTLVSALYFNWASLMGLIVEVQLQLHKTMANHISQVTENPAKFGGALIAISFLYGVFHAVGPGHGKAVIITYLGTGKENNRHGVIVAMLSAIMQSVVAITLVSLLARYLAFQLADVQNYGTNVAIVSYILVMLLGLVLTFKAVRVLLKTDRIANLFKRLKSANYHNHQHHNHSHDHSHSHSHDHSHSDTHNHSHDHSHSSGCGCSHAHAPVKNQSVLQTLTVILSMGFRPCSGAIIVLIYAHLVDVYSYGVFATVMMGLGTGLSVSLMAIATVYARTRLERLISGPDGISTRAYHFLSNYLRLAGGIFLIFFGYSLFIATSALISNHPLL